MVLCSSPLKCVSNVTVSRLPFLNTYQELSLAMLAVSSALPESLFIALYYLNGVRDYKAFLPRPDSGVLVLSLHYGEKTGTKEIQKLFVMPDTTFFVTRFEVIRVSW